MGIKTKLEKLGACPESLTWVDDRDLDAAWSECPHGAWLTWILDVAEAATTDNDALVDAMAAWDVASNAYWRVVDSGRPRRPVGLSAATADAIRAALPAPTPAVRRLFELFEGTNATNTNEGR